jgi:hypothetical protein
VGTHRETAANVLACNTSNYDHAPIMNDDWIAMLNALLDADARFLVVGAHALAVHGVPRGTQDLDILVDPTPENADRVWRALVMFGAPVTSLGITKADLVHPDMVMQFGLPPNRIDFLTSISGIADFETAWRGRVTHELRGRRTPFIGRDELIANKLAAGRRKDLADVEALGEDPDAPRVRRT